jgi:hypothetical protein
MKKKRGFAAAKRGIFTPQNPDKFFIKNNGQNGGKIVYRSSWEQKFMIWCDLTDNVEKIASEPFHIPYIDYTGKSRKYFPDFLIVYKGEMLLIEIKPKGLTNDKTNQKKFIFAESYAKKRNMKFVILTEIELKSLLKIK